MYIFILMGLNQDVINSILFSCESCNCNNCVCNAN